jgi:hypothetical protein
MGRIHVLDVADEIPDFLLHRIGVRFTGAPVPSGDAGRTNPVLSPSIARTTNGD